jgi:hypothetical protein
MDTTTGREYLHQTTTYVVELEREDIMSLVHAAHMHAEGLDPFESKRLVDSANRLSEQAVYYANGLG